MLTNSILKFNINKHHLTINNTWIIVSYWLLILFSMSTSHLTSGGSIMTHLSFHQEALSILQNSLLCISTTTISGRCQSLAYSLEMDKKISKIHINNPKLIWNKLIKQLWIQCQALQLQLFKVWATVSDSKELMCLISLLTKWLKKCSTCSKTRSWWN